MYYNACIMETLHKVICFKRRNFLIKLITLINDKSIKVGSYKMDIDTKKCEIN